jgi:hypothetical protein
MQTSTMIGVVGALSIATYVIKISKGKGETELRDEEQPTVVEENA